MYIKLYIHTYYLLYMYNIVIVFVLSPILLNQLNHTILLPACQVFLYICPGNFSCAFTRYGDSRQILIVNSLTY